MKSKFSKEEMSKMSHAEFMRRLMEAYEKSVHYDLRRLFGAANELKKKQDKENKWQTQQ